MDNWQCRWSPTLGELEDTHQNIWGTEDYKDTNKPTVFFGIYGLPDFYALWRHKGRKAVLWAGSDIRHFKNGYWLDTEGKITLPPKSLAKWLNENCENWVENKVEYEALKKLGVFSKICPSYLGNVEMGISFNPGNKVYTSVSGDNFELYGWDKLEKLAFNYPDVEFHLYGNTKPFGSLLVNIIDHGRVSKEQMNEDIKDMQGALRLTKFEGFSEILAKSVLMGQWPISLIPYPFMLSVKELGEITKKTEPNYEGRDFYRQTLNNYIWVR
jgi:hypothetical protein